MARGPRRNFTTEALVERGIRAGRTGADIARELGVSRERVRQIWKRASGQSIPPLPPLQPLDHETRRSRRRWARVRVEDSGCWGWTGGHYKAGYGSIGDPWRYAHRWTYSVVKGSIPEGLTIDHLCRNRGCVNPDHLEAVTQRENVLRSPVAPAAINARKTHCKRGHEFTPENTYLSNSGRHRNCRVCRLDQGRRYRREAAEQVA